MLFADESWGVFTQDTSSFADNSVRARLSRQPVHVKVLDNEQEMECSRNQMEMEADGE